MESYDWPGNVRQISNYMERLVILNQSKNVTKDFEITNLLDENTYSSTNIQNTNFRECSYFCEFSLRYTKTNNKKSFGANKRGFEKTT